MTRARHLATLTASSVLLIGLAGVGTASAQTCDAYSGGCASPAPTAPSGNGGGDGTGTGTGTNTGTGTSTGTGTGAVGNPGSTGSSLPVTGGELVLLLTVGAAAVGAGTVLVVAGRRKRDTTSV